MTNRKSLFAVFLLNIGALGNLFGPSISQAAELSEQEAADLAIEAYTYFFPMVLMDITRKVMTNVPAGIKPGAGPANTFSHMRKFPDANFREVVRPNFDTLYSSAWLDLSKEPMIVTVPDTQGRYYLMPMLDMWTDVFASPGKRTSGTGAGHFAVVPPKWKGQLPKGVAVIQAPTAGVWIIGRTQTNGPDDYTNVHKIQDGYKITPLSRWGKAPLPIKFTPDPSIDMKMDPMEQVLSMSGKTFFTQASELLKKHPPHVTDWSTIARLERLGMQAGKAFDYSKASATVRTALDNAPKAAIQVMQQKIKTLAKEVNGWQMNVDTMGVYGNFYLKRAIVALVGLGANQPEDAIYPLAMADVNGKVLNGANRYVIHFEKRDLPPVEAFWSITMYDAKGFQVANPINRYAIGDRDPLKFNRDGSLDIYVQHANPGADKESNWLPAPASGDLGVTMRLYAPKPAVLDGRWAPPAIQMK